MNWIKVDHGKVGKAVNYDDRLTEVDRWTSLEIQRFPENLEVS